MSRLSISGVPPLTFPDAEKSPLSIRAKALVFIDPRSRRLGREVERVAGQSLSVLVEGEMGTGKELLARHIHAISGRPGLFVALSCASLSTRSARAELFGHVTRAYPGSASSRAGWYGSANGGTLYLDEIGDLPLSLQDQLLTALETGEVTRVGAAEASRVDVRLVAATSLDLAEVVEAGKFSQALYRHLVNGYLPLPPLRERPGDILPLAEYFLGVHGQRLGLPLPAIGDGARQLLMEHRWPGNIRELENVIHFALLICDNEQILPQHLKLVGHLQLIEESLEKLVAVARPEQLAELGQLLQRAQLAMER